MRPTPLIEIFRGEMQGPISKNSSVSPAPAIGKVGHHYDGSQSAAVERYAYTAYGERIVLNPDGTEKASGIALQPYGHTGAGMMTRPAYSISEHEILTLNWADLLADPLKYVDGSHMYLEVTLFQRLYCGLDLWMWASDVPRLNRDIFGFSLDMMLNSNLGIFKEGQHRGRC